MDQEFENQSQILQQNEAKQEEEFESSLRQTQEGNLKNFSQKHSITLEQRKKDLAARKLKKT
jgi:hypothetical protein